MTNTSSVPFILRNELISIFVDASFTVKQRWKHMIIHIYTYLWQTHVPNTRCISGCRTLNSMIDAFNHYIFSIEDIYDRAYWYVQHDIPLALERMAEEEESLNYIKPIF